MELKKGKTIVDIIVNKVNEAYKNYQINLRNLQNDLLSVSNKDFCSNDAVKLQLRIAQIPIQSSVTTSATIKEHDALKMLFKQT